MGQGDRSGVARFAQTQAAQGAAEAPGAGAKTAAEAAADRLNDQLARTGKTAAAGAGGVVLEHQGGAGIDGGGAAVAEAAGQGDAAAAFGRNVAAAADGIGRREWISSVKDQSAVVGDCASAQAAACAVVADLQRAVADGGCPIAVGAAKHQGAAGQLFEAACTADGIGDHPAAAVGATELQRCIIDNSTGAELAAGGVIAHPQGAGADGGGAAVGVLSSQHQGAGSGFAEANAAAR